MNTALQHLSSTRTARLGERQSQAWIDYGRPDVFRSELRHYKRKRIAVVGDGDDAERMLEDLGLLARDKPNTTVTHVTRRRDPRGCAPCHVRIEGFRVHGFYPTEGGVILEGDDGRWIGPFDRLIINDQHDQHDQ